MHFFSALFLGVSMAAITGCGQSPAPASPQESVSGSRNGQTDVPTPSSVAVLIADDDPLPETVPGPQEVEIERGQRLYQRQCGACHSLDQNRVGPRHRGVVGRAAGSISDFRYSAALQKLDLVWTVDALEDWLANPSAVAPGTAMGFRLRKREDRAAIIAYLATQSIPNTNP